MLRRFVVVLVVTLAPFAASAEPPEGSAWGVLVHASTGDSPGNVSIGSSWAFEADWEQVIASGLWVGAEVAHLQPIMVHVVTVSTFPVVIETTIQGVDARAPPSLAWLTGSQSGAGLGVRLLLPPHASVYVLEAIGVEGLRASDLAIEADPGVRVRAVPVSATFLTTSGMDPTARVDARVPSTLGGGVGAQAHSGASFDVRGLLYGLFVNSVATGVASDAMRGPAYDERDLHVYRIQGGAAGAWLFDAPVSAGTDRWSLAFALDVPPLTDP